MALFTQMKTKPLPTNGTSRLPKLPFDRTPQTIPEHHAAEIAIRKVLVPTDFSAASLNASNYAMRLARKFGSELIFLHVLPLPLPASFEACPIDYPPELTGECEESLNTIVRSARDEGVKAARSVVRPGIPTHEIVEAAKEFDTDLIVIATHGYTGWKHFAIGSTAERVVRAAPCPVLVVREKEHEFA